MQCVYVCRIAPMYAIRYSCISRHIQSPWSSLNNRMITSDATITQCVFGPERYFVKISHIDMIYTIRV